MEEVWLRVGVEVGAHRAFVGLVPDGRLFELLRWHTKRRGEENAAVGAPQDESLWLIADGADRTGSPESRAHNGTYGLAGHGLVRVPYCDRVVHSPVEPD